MWLALLAAAGFLVLSNKRPISDALGLNTPAPQELTVNGRRYVEAFGVARTEGVVVSVFRKFDATAQPVPVFTYVQQRGVRTLMGSDPNTDREVVDQGLRDFGFLETRR